MASMDAIEELSQLSDSMRQAAALLADEEVDETPSAASSKRASTFLNVVALGNTVSMANHSFVELISLLESYGVLESDLDLRSHVISDLDI